MAAAHGVPMARATPRFDWWSAMWRLGFGGFPTLGLVAAMVAGDTFCEGIVNGGVAYVMEL